VLKVVTRLKKKQKRWQKTLEKKKKGRLKNNRKRQQKLFWKQVNEEQKLQQNHLANI
jgi:hypothetical protein